jgi:hypothetical protein
MTDRLSTPPDEIPDPQAQRVALETAPGDLDIDEREGIARR